MTIKDRDRRVIKTSITLQQQILTTALVLNATMFFIGAIVGVIGQSSSLIADSLDMLADAAGYVIALAAINRPPKFKITSALFSGSVLLVLGIGVLADVLRRYFGSSEPVSLLMIGAAALSLVVNGFVLHLLGRFRHAEIHLRAAFIETRVDVIANLAVITAGVVVLISGSRYADLAVGAAIGVYVIKEAIELLGETREEAKRL